MGQIKIYGLRKQLVPIREVLSDVVHTCVVDAFAYPASKRAHRFFYLDPEDFFFPEGRSENYVIIEITLFEGRSTEAKKTLYRLLFERFQSLLGITPNDVEIVLYESPRHNWSIRGKAGDELELDYKITV